MDKTNKDLHDAFRIMSTNTIITAVSQARKRYGETARALMTLAAAYGKIENEALDKMDDDFWEDV